MTRDYSRLSLEEFGQKLIEANDLDPIYTMLHRGKLDQNQLRRWCLAYWCFYSAGVVSWISERKDADFWSVMMEAAINMTPSPIGERWPRGRERRHFRGDKCVDAIHTLARRYPQPEDAVASLEQPGSYARVQDKVMKWPLFGPWIAFKVGDMLDRVLGVPIDFTGSDIFFFDSPRIAAEEWVGGYNKIGAAGKAVVHLEKHLGHMDAPPRFERKLNLQEYETVLCKWHSHMTGFYPIGIDTHELHEALLPWSDSSLTAKELAQCL